MKISQEVIKRAAIELHPILNRMRSGDDSELSMIYRARDEVIDQFRPIFSPEHIPQITVDEFRSFLIFKNNRHWKALQRFGGLITADMDLLRRALSILIDESRPIDKRLDLVLPKGSAMVKRLGRAIITPILMIAYPEKYGVMNMPAVEAMKTLDIWPEIDESVSFGKRYVAVNEVLLELAKELQIDLWTLDGLWWGVLLARGETPPEDEETPEIEPPISVAPGFPPARFGLERYLHEFMRDNWDSIPELKDWLLYEEDGDPVGYEYNAGEVGRIDLLARHRTQPRWLVIELKRNQTSDETVGQMLRYMGWVSEHMTDSDEQVNGLVICNACDERLRYALMFTKNVDLMVYEVQFNLRRIS